MDNGRKRELLEQLVDGLCAERGYEPLEAEKADELWTAFRALVNTRPPIPADPAWLAMQDELLRGIIAEAGVSTVDDVGPSRTTIRPICTASSLHRAIEAASTTPPRTALPLSHFAASARAFSDSRRKRQQLSP